MKMDDTPSLHATLDGSIPAIRAIDWGKSVPFLAFHLSPILLYWTAFDWKWPLLALASYYVRMFAITAGYHRYFAHRTYKTSRVFQFCLAFLGTTALQKGVLWWAAHHRVHHRFSDLEGDVHSAKREGFFWSHMGWILSDAHMETRFDQIADLRKFPELRLLNRFHLVPPVLFAIVCFGAGGLAGLTWVFFIATTLLWHGVFLINSGAHRWGTRRYVSNDESRNNFWLALITLGEGWHNNHHTYMSSTRQGFFWWELDVTYLALRAFSRMGIVWDLRAPPLHLLESRRVVLKKSAVVTMHSRISAVDAVRS